MGRTKGGKKEEPQKGERMREGCKAREKGKWRLRMREKKAKKKSVKHGGRNQNQTTEKKKQYFHPKKT